MPVMTRIQATGATGVPAKHTTAARKPHDRCLLLLALRAHAFWQTPDGDPEPMDTQIKRCAPISRSPCQSSCIDMSFLYQPDDSRGPFTSLALIDFVCRH